MDGFDEPWELAMADKLKAPPDPERAEGRDVVRHVHLVMRWDGNEWQFDRNPKVTNYYHQREAEKSTP